MSAGSVVRAGGVEFGGGRLALIAGPCVAESLDLCMEVAESVKGICAEMGIGYVFKASFDKANRQSADSPRGPGLDAGLAILAAVRNNLGVPVLTDVHEVCQVEAVASVVDIIQIPAFLCRQTDLVVAAAATGKAVNVKKGQFMAPEAMGSIVEKARAAGSGGVMLTERGTAFGYGDLVVDMRGLVIMRELGCPVVFDATHSVQRPGGSGSSSGGNPEFVPALVRAACAVGIDALFLETHPNPKSALSDAATMLPLGDLRGVLEQAAAVRGSLK